MADTEDLLAAAADLFQPFTQAIRSRATLDVFLQKLGWKIAAAGSDTDLVAVFGPFGSAVQKLQQDATGGSSAEALATDLGAVVTALAQAGSSAIANLPPPLNQSAFWSSFPIDLMEFLLFDWVRRRAPLIFGILRAVGALDNVAEQADPTSGRAAWIRHQLRIERLGQAVTSPTQLFSDVYGWGGQFKHATFVDALAALLSGFRLEASISPVNRSLADILYAPTNDSLPDVQQVVATLLTKSIETDIVAAIVKIAVLAIPIPPKNDKTLPPVGFALVPFFSGMVSTSIAIAKGTTLELIGGLDLSIVRAEIRPDGTTLSATPPTESISASAILSWSRTPPLVLVGGAQGTHLEASSAKLTLGYSLSASDSEFTIAATVDGFALILTPPADDAFVGQAIGGSPGRVQLPGQVSWSSKHGVKFGTSGQLDITIPLHISLGGLLELIEARITGEQPQGAGAQLVATVSGTLMLGPIEATVSRIGLRLRASSASVDHPGNLGLLQVDIAFKPPDGIGFEINAVAVTGGGFISHDEQKQEYDGILVLEVEDVVSVKAIAILTTGPNNFSLAALVFVEDFTPIQLGLGFTLDGIGGMVAINRQADIAVLQAGIKTGLINDLLFPADPIHDAVRIISNLERAFPIAQGRYLFGPMVQIGWGEPEPLIFAELGLLIELPSPVRLIILGKIEALLPKPEAHIVELHMDVLGVVDFAASSLAIDATLHDSRVAAFAITGDMALRLIWAGPGRTFMLSVGGFNPRYQPPPGFPKLNRLAITLATSDNPKLRLDSYMALTSNTAQIGAHLELIATAGSFGVHGEVGFDALLQFEPFLFIVDIHAGIVLLVSGSPFMSLILDGTLTGPNPWHVHGDASYHVLFFSISVTVDFTIGQAVVEPPPPQPQIHANLVNALSAPGNWGAQVSQARTFVTLRKVEANGKLLAHPVGVLSAHQKVVPLEVEIERFGSVKLDHPHTFAIPSQSVKVNGVTAASSSAVPDYFAMAQFKELSDDEKLSRPSFEPYPAGVRVDAEAPTVGTPHRRDVLYDEVIVDPGAQDTHQKVPMTIDQFTAHRVPSGITRSDRLGRRRFGGPTRTIPLHDTSYLVATTDTLTRNDIAGVGARATFTQAVDALRRHTSQNVADRGRLQVVAGHEVAG